MTAIKALPPHQLADPPKTITLEGSEVGIPEKSFAPKFSYLEEGAKVDVITVGDVIVTIAKSA
jgi:valyl-tRNA synthetase